MENAGVTAAALDHRAFEPVKSVPALVLLVAALLTPDAAAAPDFARDVEPVLKRSCLACHGAAAAQGGLSLSTREAALKGGVSGPAIVPGDAAASLAVKRLREAPGLPRMPMGLPALTEAEVAALRAWIDAGAAWPAAAGPDFVRDIQPILSTRCTPCHGPDTQQSQLRLDSRTAALRGGLSGPVIVPGKGGESLLLQRLTGKLQPRMPFQLQPLPAADIDKIRAWIDAGATGPEDAAPVARKHWAYVKPARPEPPLVKNAGWVRNPIDRFVLARLEAEGLAPSPEADRTTLARRASLDLVGLPPTLAELDAFLADTSPTAYEKLVERLLASPRYGERWARPWLDLARYADTNGYERDRRRTAYKYRDWVIAALDADMPFRQFTIEQLAGDMLPEPTLEQRIATGFHRNTLLNQEGGIDVEEARWETLVDRVNTTAAVWLGSTLGCAQCHNHKFDPFSQRDYYRMLAFFDNVEYRVQGEGPRVMDRWIVEPELELPTSAQLPALQRIDAEIKAVEDELRAPNAELDAAQAAWEAERRAPPPAWTPLRTDSATAAAGTTLTAQPDGSLVASGALPDAETFTVIASVPIETVAAVRLEAFVDPPGEPVGRSEGGNFFLNRFSARIRDTAGNETPLPFVRAEADLVEPSWRVSDALDDDPTTGWAVGSETDRSHVAVFAAPEPVAARGGRLVIALEQGGRQKGALLRRFRLSVTPSQRPFGGLPPSESFRAITPLLDAERRRLRALRKERSDLRVETALVMRERAGFARPSTRLRLRGTYLAPGETVYAGVPAILHGLPEEAPANRLGLAQWLASDENPLTLRVVVNRAWEAFFGRGLVLTSEDFGTQGERPSHPELLDWLATEFQRGETRWKALHRLIVTSASYRQSSRATPSLLEKDPDNRLLARGPRFRLEAEAVRDVALAASGLLSPKVGGPSVFPDQPDGIWDNPYSDDKWTTSEGKDRYRRSLYTFIRRTAPYPMLATFDAPSREQCTVRRVRTNTPLQALITLNDPGFVAAARALAQRVLREAGKSAEERAEHAFRLCTARRPSAAERARLLAFHAAELARYQKDAAAARLLAGGDEAEAGRALAERAAWTMVANVVLNLDETLVKE
jgi:hypothetical protein